MVTMQLALNIDAQRFIQQLKLNNEDVEAQVQNGLDKAFKELSQEGVIEQLIVDTAKKNIMDSFSKWIFQADIRKNIETQIQQKLAAKIDAYTTRLVDELAEKMNLPE
jgi:hypothetical protein